MAPKCPRSPPDTHSFVQNTQEFADFWGFSRRRKTQLIAAFLRSISSSCGLLHGSLHVGGKRRPVLGGDRSGARDLRSGIPVSPTEKFPGTWCRQVKMCQKSCTFTHFFEMGPIRSPIAKIHEILGAVKP